MNQFCSKTDDEREGILQYSDKFSAVLGRNWTEMSRKKVTPDISHQSQFGFTLIELLISVAIIGMTIIGSISMYGRLQVSSQLNEQAARTIGILRSAHIRALSGHGGNSQGVFFDIGQNQNHRIIEYQGTSYTVRDATADLVETYPASISLSLQLSTSTPEIIFSRISGTPSATGTVTLTLSGQGTRVIAINRIGMIEEVE